MAETATEEELNKPPRKRRWKWIVCIGVCATLILALGWHVCHVHRRMEAERRLAAVGELHGMPRRSTWYHKLAVRAKLRVPARPINFSSSKITNSEMIYVSKLPSLLRVAIYRAPVTDAGLEHLTELKKLDNLILVDMQITDAGLEHVGKLTSLEQLFLTGTKVTDSGLVQLQALENLRYLSLGRTQITDKGLLHLRDLKNLHTLYLNDTDITDEGIEHLRSIKSLRQVSLGRTKASASAIENLQQALPNLRIVGSPSSPVSGGNSQ